MAVVLHILVNIPLSVFHRAKKTNFMIRFSSLCTVHLCNQMELLYIRKFFRTGNVSFFVEWGKLTKSKSTYLYS